jgi:hypothetical protein
VGWQIICAEFDDRVAGVVCRRLAGMNGGIAHIES